MKASRRNREKTLKLQLEGPKLSKYGAKQAAMRARLAAEAKKGAKQ